MQGIIEYETERSLENNKARYNRGETVPDDERDFMEVPIHFDKRMLGEFFTTDKYIFSWINGRKYLLLYDEDLYNEMCTVHS